MSELKFEDAPIFIIASERSGTNLLRKRLTENQDHYLGPSPAHFLKHLYYQQPYYGDLYIDENFRAFVSNALDLCLVHFAPWNIDWTAENIMVNYGDNRRNSINLMHYMMNRYAKEQGFSGYICKDNYLYEFALDIASHIPSARFIYLYRDPRDFVLSQIKRPGVIKSVARFSKLWKYEQTKSIAVAEQLKSDGKCSFLSYEDLISDENGSINRVLSFLKLERSESKNYAENVHENVHEWSNLSKDTMRDNSEKFLKEMTGKKVGLVESICHTQMEYLGYRFVTDSTKQPSKTQILTDFILGLISRKVSSFFRRFDQNSAVARRQKVLSKIKVDYRSDLF